MRTNYSLEVSTSLERFNDSDFTTRNVSAVLNGQDDLLLLETELTIQEKVVIGALSTVAVLSTLAVVLRIIMPMYRRTNQKLIRAESRYTEEVSVKERKYGQLPSKASSLSSSPASSSWSSSSQLDMSDSSSNKTRSTYYTSESKNMSLSSQYGNFRGSTASLPLSVTDERSGRSRASSYLRFIKEDPVYILNKKCLEPLKLDDAYRSRWDEEFDPKQVMTSRSLASLSHPSEDRNIPDRVPHYHQNRIPIYPQDSSKDQYDIRPTQTQPYRL